MQRKMIAINYELGQELQDFAERKHGTLHGAVKVEAEVAIKKHIRGG